jgi:uncharacterized protein with ParB-like and HNH nuclease domain
MAPSNDEPWFEDYMDEDDEPQVEEYDLTSTPNDFNVITIFNFIQSGAVKIPGFQRNYVWDIKRASKLIESLILGLPVPQVFLYEEGRNKFLVIDGQQRLMSIYYFLKQRFPRKERRVELRTIFDEKGQIPDNVLGDDSYFSDFKLTLPEKVPDRPNRFKNLKYSTLGDHRTQFELRPIRNVVVKQNVPKDDDSSVYEIFYRLNSGGVNLRPQEIRTSLYHSKFYDMLHRLNSCSPWRRILGQNAPDLHMKDIEILLRGIALLVDGENYTPSMTKFLNGFSRRCKRHTDDQNGQIEKVIQSFLERCDAIGTTVFVSKRTKRFNIALFESAFAAVCSEAFHERAPDVGPLTALKFEQLDQDPEFVEAAQKATTQTANVKKRLQRARAVLLAE